MLKTRSVQAVTGQTLTLSGLSGDTDGEYIIKGRIIVPALTSNTLSLRPNGLTTNLEGRKENSGNYGTSGSTATTWELIAISNAFTGSPVMIDLEVRMNASKTLNGQTCFVSFVAHAVLFNTLATVEIFSIESAGWWNQTSVELSSVVLHSSDASGIEAGSELLCFNPSASFGA